MSKKYFVGISTKGQVCDLTFEFLTLSTQYGLYVA